MKIYYVWNTEEGEDEEFWTSASSPEHAALGWAWNNFNSHDSRKGFLIGTKEIDTEEYVFIHLYMFRDTAMKKSEV